MNRMTFDAALPALVDVVMMLWGEEAVRNNLFLRDASGRLTFVVIDRSKSGAEREALSQQINAVLGPYADPDGLSAVSPDELFDEDLWSSQIGMGFPVQTSQYQDCVRLLDRRVVGSDWLHGATGLSAKIPCLFFASLKGGVGRSTALCVLAAHLAANGRRVLAIDLDIEAPGLGSLLLTEETLPEYGVLDYLVEFGVGDMEDAFFSDMIASSQFANGHGVISVAPVMGKRSMANPENVLSKIARAYLPKGGEMGERMGFSGKIEALIKQFSRYEEYDVILADARAGLHETTAASIVGLTGDTFLFGIDQHQTYIGYKALFAQLALTLGSSWFERIHLVEARVGLEGPSDDFVANMLAALPSEPMPSDASGIPLEQLRTVFEVEWNDKPMADDEALPLHMKVDCTFIYDHKMFYRFDPFKNPKLLESKLYAAVFGEFLQSCDGILARQENRTEDEAP